MNHNGSLIQEVLDRNRLQSELFCSPDAYLARKRYRSLHPTEILWFKCMDGRLNGPVMTDTPVGIIQPIRNIAGTFDLGWPYLGEIFSQWVDYAIKNGRRCLPFVTYHWSKGDKHRGCRGHDYDVEKARLDANNLVKNIEYAFGKEHEVVYPILAGIETDEDSIVLHGNGHQLDLVTGLEDTKAVSREAIRELYPDMDKQVLSDLLAPAEGNVRHISSLRANPRSVEQATHCEQIMAIGRGFDWLHWLNRALIIGPYSYDLAQPIETAARIVLDNIRSGRVSQQDGVLLVTSGVYRQPTGYQPRLAALKAASLERFAVGVIRDRVPELYNYLHVLSGTVDVNTRLFHVLSQK